MSVVTTLRIQRDVLTWIGFRVKANSELFFFIWGPWCENEGNSELEVLTLQL